MSEVGVASVAIIPTFKGFRSKISDEADGAGKESGSRFTSAFKGLVGPALALAGSGIFAGFIAEAARASDATDKFKSTMNFAGLDTSAITAAKDAAKAYADQTVYDLPTIQQTMAQLASNGVKNYTDITKAAGNLNAVAGGNAETFKSVSRTLTQSAGAGKLMTEDWNMLADAIPGASGPLQKALLDAGAYTGNFRKAMEQGQITSEEFQAALLQLGNDPVAVEAAKSTKTFEGAIGNLQATINSGLMSALDAMKPAITGVINLLAGGLGKSFEWIGLAFTGLVALFSRGDFTAALGKAFNVSEDSGFVNFLFNVRDTAVEVGGGFRAMFAAFKAGDGDITSSGFAGFMERVGGAARQLFDAIGPAIASVLPQVVSLWSAFSPLQIIFAAIQPVLPQLVAVFSQLASVVGSTLSSALTALVPLSAVLSQTLGGVLAAVLPAVVQVVTMLGEALTRLLPVVVPIITTVVTLAAAFISQLVPIILQLVTGILPPLISIFENIVAAIGPLLSIVQALMPVVMTVFGAIVNVIVSAMQIVQGIIQVVTGIISGDWGKVWEGISNIFGGIWNTIVAVIGGAIGIVWSVITNGLNLVFGFIGNVLGNIGNFFADTWDNVTRGISDFIGGVGKFFEGLPDAIMDALSGAGQWLFDAGKNIVQGLFDGIKSLASTIGNFFLGLLPGWIVEPFKLALGIHSPSRVFKGFGQNIGQGLIDGIDGMSGKIQATTESMVAIPSVPSLAISAGASGGVGSGLGLGNNVTNNFYELSSPRATALQVARIQEGY